MAVWPTASSKSSPTPFHDRVESGFGPIRKGFPEHLPGPMLQLLRALEAIPQEGRVKWAAPLSREGMVGPEDGKSLEEVV